jgi:hypothetical protein
MGWVAAPSTRARECLERQTAEQTPPTLVRGRGAHLQRPLTTTVPKAPDEASLRVNLYHRLLFLREPLLRERDRLEFYSDSSERITFTTYAGGALTNTETVRLPYGPTKKGSTSSASTTRRVRHVLRGRRADKDLERRPAHELQISDGPRPDFPPGSKT